VVWGDRDPYIPASFADAYAAALGGPAEVLHLPDAGHWPWLDRPDVVGTVADFLGA
jgi:pimeloyl-ACP methyl ester carboxylesterase